ncbi:MAG: hypothetical protein ACRDIY_20840 [Chloroflexota bacterium]
MNQTPAVPIQWPANRPTLGPVARAALVIVVALVVYLATVAGGGVVFGALALGALAGFLIWTRPIVGLVALVVLGPPHQFLMVLVLHFTGSATVLKVAEVWKDLVVVLLLAKAIDLAFHRKRPPTVYLLDLGIVIFMVMAAFYVFYPTDLAGSTLLVSVLGLRLDAFFLVAYFLGRGLTVTRRQVRLLLIAFFLITLVIAVVAVAQFVAPGAMNLVFNQLGYQDFIDLKLGTEGTNVAIRANDFGGFVVPRASSLVLSDLALGFYTLLAAPLAAGLLLHFPRTRDRIVGNIILLAAVGTAFLTVTRSAILAQIPALGTIMLRARGAVYILLLLAEVTFAAMPVAYQLRINSSVIRAVFSPDNGSIQGHFAALTDSLVVIRENPLGRGLGTAGQIAQVADVQGGITNEDWYLQLATEIGVVPALVYLVIVVGFGVTAFARYGQARDPWVKTLCLGMAGATIGFGLVGFALHVWEAETISIIFWLFAGMVVQAPSIESEAG